MNTEAGLNKKSESTPGLVKQHLIDPTTCLRCGGCEATCPEGAVKFDSVTFAYAIDPDLCDGVHECVSVCSSNAINSWHTVPADRMYSLQEQFSWEELPEQTDFEGQAVATVIDEEDLLEGTLPPASASEPTTYLYTAKNPLIVPVKSNERATIGDNEVHHIVLDFSATDFRWLEGQNIGILPEGKDGNGHDHVVRAYSIASERNGETPGGGDMALTIKRLIDQWEGKPYYGVCSNYVCNMEPGSEVRVVGPIGDKFLMPEDPNARVVMIATGTGIAPMRSFIQRQQRSGKKYLSPMQLFYGGRTPGEMAYFDELLSIPKTLLETHVALSRSSDSPKRYVQDVLLEQADDLAQLLKDERGCVFICGLIAMEQGVMDVLAKVSAEHGMDWDTLHHRLLREGRLQIEVY